MNKPKPVRRVIPHLVKFKFNVYRDDGMPAFAGWHAHPDPAHQCMLLSVVGHFGDIRNEDGSICRMTNRQRKRMLVESMMHEFGHAVEQWLGLPVNERAIEAATNSFKSKLKPKPQLQKRNRKPQ